MKISEIQVGDELKGISGTPHYITNQDSIVRVQSIQAEYNTFTGIIIKHSSNEWSIGQSYDNLIPAHFVKANGEKKKGNQKKSVVEKEKYFTPSINVQIKTVDVRSSVSQYAGEFAYIMEYGPYCPPENCWWVTLSINGNIEDFLEKELSGYIETANAVEEVVYSKPEPKVKNWEDTEKAPAPVKYSSTKSVVVDTTNPCKEIEAKVEMPKVSANTQEAKLLEEALQTKVTVPSKRKIPTLKTTI